MFRRKFSSYALAVLLLAIPQNIFAAKKCYEQLAALAALYNKAKAHTTKDATAKFQFEQTSDGVFLVNKKTGKHEPLLWGEGQMLTAKGVKFDSSDVTTVAIGTGFAVINNKDGKVWRSFDVGSPINQIELVEYTYSAGGFEQSATMAVVTSGKKLYAIDIQSEEPKIISSVELPGEISNVEIGKFNHVVQMKVSKDSDATIGVEVTSIKGDVEIKGGMGKLRYLMDGGKLEFKDRLQTYIVLRRKPQPDLGKSELDLSKSTVVANPKPNLEVHTVGDEVYLYNTRSGGSFSLGKKSASDQVSAVSGIKYDPPSDVTTVAIGNRFSIFDHNRGNIWQTFDVGSPINHIELVEYTFVSKGPIPVEDNATMAVVISGKKLMTIDVQSEMPKVISSIELPAEIESIDTGKFSHVIKAQALGGIGVEVTSLKADVKLKGTAKPVRYTMNQGELKVYP